MKKLIGIFSALAMFLSFAMTATAADWNFYGNARVGTFVQDTENPGAADVDTLAMGLQGNSRIGARVQVSDELRGRFEYGTGVNVRHLFGEWDFGAGKLLVGQTYTPMEYGVSNQVVNDDTGLGDYGSTSVGRTPMLRLTFGGLKIAAVAPNDDDLGTGGTIEHDLPKIEAAYEFGFNNVAGEIGAGFNEYEIISGAQSYDVDSWVVSLGVEVSFGGFFFLGSIYTGENLGAYGLDTASDSLPAVSGTSLMDSDGFGFNLVAGYQFNDMFRMEAGYGYEESERDGAVSEDDSESYYVQLEVTLAPGVVVTPEIGVFDHKTDATGAQEDETVYYGAKWQISF